MVELIIKLNIMTLTDPYVNWIIFRGRIIYAVMIKKALICFLQIKAFLLKLKEVFKENHYGN